MLAFIVLSLLSGPLGLPVLYALAAVAAACSGLFLHYRRRAARAVIEPVTPLRDDRVIPQDVKIAVAVRDKGLCQIKGPPCTVQGQVYDHKFPHSKGGSSKDPDNIQMACKACNLWKSDKILV
jgi:hypothetical protein